MENKKTLKGIEAIVDMVFNGMTVSDMEDGYRYKCVDGKICFYNEYGDWQVAGWDLNMFLNAKFKTVENENENENE